uniref:Uncharacterized protein n=1 Tax=Anguilla anguilla TaxID=7936 RepID=A0A0E9SVM8_ANGAN
MLSSFFTPFSLVFLPLLDHLRSYLKQYRKQQLWLTLQTWHTTQI